MTRFLAASLTAAALALPARAEIVGESFAYSVDGAAFEGFVAHNAALDAPRGTVLIVHDWDGVNEHEERTAERLAALGYTAFAIDMYGADADPQGVEDYRALTGALYGDRDLLRTRLMGAIEAAADIPGSGGGTVLIGYCFGGAVVLEGARAGAGLDGYVSFHGGLGTPEGQDYAAADAPVLLLHGTADPVSGMADLAALLDELESAGVAHRAEVYGGARHAFTVHGSDDYDMASERRAWSALQGFLEERL